MIEVECDVMDVAVCDAMNVDEVYSDLIKEAFVEPIRHVTVVDDEYPMLADMIDAKLKNSEGCEVGLSKFKSENLERLRSIMAMCHNDRNWSLDVYDGVEPDSGEGGYEYPRHINHSDLLILDYHLDGQSDSDGGRARNILCKLATNNHFNLVIVHTKGNSGSIRQVFEEILQDFLYLRLSEFEVQDDIDEKISEYFEENALDSENNSIRDFDIDILEIAKTLSDEKDRYNCRNPKHPFNAFKNEVVDIASSKALNEKEVIKYFLYIQLKRYRCLSKDNRTFLESWEYDENYNYIATGKVFITVLRKVNEDSSSVLPDGLVNALTNHNPSPMMLLMAKMRSELNEKGLGQANSIINNRFAQAGWLYDLLENSGKDKTKHGEAIERHWEQLSKASMDPLIDFSSRLVKSLKIQRKETKELVKDFFKECIGENHKTLAHLNAYSCSRPVSSNHLITGTVLSSETNGAVEYWLCLTPACDLVPSQRLDSRRGSIGEDYLPFQAIQLIQNACNLSTALEDVCSNEYVFIEIDGGDVPLHLKFSDGNPRWETFYAKSLGVFQNNNKLTVRCPWYERDEKGLQLRELEMNAVVELRYEYALNLLHKFGTNQSRVGLGFVKSVW